MNLIQQAKSLSPLRKNQQLMAFYMLFVAALMIAIIAKQYISIFGAEGIVLKDYALSLYGLILLFPFLGKWVTQNPMKTFHISIVLEIIATIGYYLSTKNYYPEHILIISTFILVTSNLIMNPLVTKVDSQVIDGCAEYSLFKTKLSSIYTALGALFGGFILLFDVSVELSIFIVLTLLPISRYYRNKVFKEIYL